MHLFASTEAPAAAAPRERADIPAPLQVEPHAHLCRLGRRGRRRTTSSTRRSPRSRRCRARLPAGRRALLAALKLRDEIGQLEYKVWYFASLWYDQDQRDNQINAQAAAGADSLRQGGAGVRLVRPGTADDPAGDSAEWMAASPTLARLSVRHRGAVPAAGARARRQGRAPAVAVEPLLVARRTTPTRRSRPPTSSSRPSAVDGAEVTLTYGQYRAILATNRNQADRAAAFHAFHELYEANVNTYASLYNGVLQRDWFLAQARGYASTLDAALHGNNIPTAVVENLIATTKQGVEPLRRYHRLRKRVLGLTTYHSYDTTIPLVDFDRTVSVRGRAGVAAGIGGAARRRLSAAAARGRSPATGSTSTRIPGKRSGAYSAPVYGVHPYMLLNYNDTLDAVFTLAHEMGHSMHTLLSHQHQPFVYAGYTIFVAEVPSTLNEALFLDFMLARDDRSTRADRAAAACDRRHRRHVLHAGDVRRLRAAGAPAGGGRAAGHRRRARRDLLRHCCKAYHGDALDYDERRARPGRGSRTSSARRTTSISTPPVSPRAPS